MVETRLPLASTATTTTENDVTPSGGVPVKERSVGENLIQSGKGAPLAVVAEICTDVPALLWVKVLSGSTSVKEPTVATGTVSKVRTPVNPGPDAPDAACTVSGGVTLPVTAGVIVVLDDPEAAGAGALAALGVAAGVAAAAG